MPSAGIDRCGTGVIPGNNSRRLRVYEANRPHASFTHSASEDFMLSLRLAAVSSLLMCTIGCGADYTSPASPSPSPSPTPDGPTASVTIVAGAETLGNRAFAP